MAFGRRTRNNSRSWRVTLLVALFCCIVGPDRHVVGMSITGVGGGGRAPQLPNMPSLDTADTSASTVRPAHPSEARLTVIQITDVYTLEHLASLKTLIAEKRAETAKVAPESRVISMLTGDFLAPYLLSSVDKGAGMMNALAKIPIDYLTWGNHEADVDHRTVCRHVKNFPGIWLNTNMQTHDAMDYQKVYDVVEVRSRDKSNTRRIGLVGLLSDDPALYSHFKAPGAFGGAKIRDPWDTLREYKSILETTEKCDVVVPLQHTYVPDDHKTCRDFDVPVVLSGHDHHRVDEVVSGTRLLKPGLDAICATVLDLSWDDAEQSGGAPRVRSTFVECDRWDPDPELEEENRRAYDALLPLRNTELARVPPTFEPLSSVNSRGRVCTMGKFICSLIRSSLNHQRRQREHRVDAVLLMGGNIRAGSDYPPGSFFSLEALEAEIKPDEVVGVVSMPGWLLAEGIEATHKGDPIPGWFQYDEGVQEEYTPEGEPVVTTVGGKPLDRDFIYRVATKISDLTNGQSPPLTEYYTANPRSLPAKGAYTNIHAELMSFFARNLWRKIWEAIAPPIGDEDELCGVADSCQPERRLAMLDVDNDGVVTVDDIHTALDNVLGLSVDETERKLAEFVYSFADTTGDGTVTLKDFQKFCTEMPMLYESEKWRLAFPRAKDRPTLQSANP